MSSSRLGCLEKGERGGAWANIVAGEEEGEYAVRCRLRSHVQNGGGANDKLTFSFGTSLLTSYELG